MPLLEHTEFEVPVPDTWKRSRFCSRGGRRLCRFWAAPLPAALALISSVALAVSVRLPHTTAAIEACRKLAAGPYPGEVRLAASHITDSATRIKLHIEQADGRELVVVCDGVQEKIVRVIRIDD